MEISKEQIIALENKEVTAKELFPDVFKVELEVGKWAFVGTDTVIHIDALIMLSNAEFTYGFNHLGSYTEKYYSKCVERDFKRYATTEEVTDALAKKAVRRGFKKGVLIKRPFDVKLKDLITDDTYLHEGREWFFDLKEKYLEYHGFVIFSNGIWAEIIPQEVRTFTESQLVSFTNFCIEKRSKEVSDAEFQEWLLTQK